MSTPPRIYLDHAATTPLDPRVLEAMTPYFFENFANPSSLHTPGQTARKAVDTARRSMADSLNAKPTELVFTSGGTESNNLALFGIAHAYADHGKHLITSAIEHEAILEPLHALEKQGFTVTILPVDSSGKIKLDALRATLTPETTLVTLMAANNEIGTIQPLPEIRTLLDEFRKSPPSSPPSTSLSTPARSNAERPTPPFLHTDACQAAGVLDLSSARLGIDLLTLNGSKIYGPKGVGLLYIRDGIRLAPQMLGGGQERKRRSGTHNVPGIIGLAEAFRLATAERLQENERLTSLRQRLLTGLQTHLPDILLNGHPADRLPNNLNLTLHGVEGEILLMRLDMEGIDASAGSACTSGSNDPSHVLLALGRSKREAYQSVRLTLGRSNTDAQIDHVIEVFTRVVRDIRRESGTY